mgnify:FL=1
MKLKSARAMFMRGGTSKALVFDVRDLPENRTEWDAIFLAAMGSPDSAMRQLDGMGGGISSLSKVCVVSAPTRQDADVDSAKVDYAGNCGNMVSAMGPAALELGYVQGDDEEITIRIHNTNTSKIISSTFVLENGLLASHGDLKIDGVAGSAAPIRLDFFEPGAAKTPSLLPSGSAVEELELGDGIRVRASLVDAANPCVFVAAADLGKEGTESPEYLASDREFMTQMEKIRCAGSVRMGLTPNLQAAAEMASIPKVAIVAAPADSWTLAGSQIKASEASLNVRMISMEQPHRALPITGAICLAIACRIPDSIPARFAQLVPGPLTLSHPSGSLLVDADVVFGQGSFFAKSGTVYRTARKLFSGEVFYRQ